MKKKVLWLLLLSLSIMSISNFTVLGYSAEVRVGETNGSIGFKGFYEPIGSPNPEPPGGVVDPPNVENRPVGSLPNTNEQIKGNLVLLGCLLLVLALNIWAKKRNYRFIEKEGKKNEISTFSDHHNVTDVVSRK